MTQHVMTESGGMRQTQRQTARKQVKEDRLLCGIAAMCEAHLILVKGHWELSGIHFYLKKPYKT